MGCPAIHAGEILGNELAELDVKPTELVRQLDVPANRIAQIVQAPRHHERHGATPNPNLLSPTASVPRARSGTQRAARPRGE